MCLARWGAKKTLSLHILKVYVSLKDGDNVYEQKNKNN